MIKFIKGFKGILPESIQFIILIVLSVFAIVSTVWFQTRFFGFVQSLLPITLIAFGVYLLQVKKETFLAHAILFFLFYSDHFGGFIRSILSYNFGNSAFSTPLTLNILLCMAGSVYLILFLASHIIDGKVKLNFQFTKSAVLWPLIAMIIYAYFRYSFLTAVVWALPVVVSMLAGVPLAAMMFLIRCFIAIPFGFIDTAFNGTFQFTSINYWFFLAAALYILTISIIRSIPMFKALPIIKVAKEKPSTES